MSLLKLSAALGCAIFGGLQLAPGPGLSNPPTKPERTLEANLEVPAEVTAILDRSCRDCHSNETKWPWYSHVAPVKWLIAKDVEKARGIMNFSEWSDQAGKKLESAIGMLAASCADVTAGRMPKPDYAFLHTEAKLDKQDVKRFCDWSQKEGKRLLVLKRKRASRQ